jgi:flagellin-like protein
VNIYLSNFIGKEEQMQRIKGNARAISPVLAVLMMIAIAIAGSLVTYAWAMGYIGFTTEKSGKALMIHSVINDRTDTDLIVYVQNVGEGTLEFDPIGCFYVNGELVDDCKITIDGVTYRAGETALLPEGSTATLTDAGGAAETGEKKKVKVASALGAFSEKSAYPQVHTIFSDGFEGGDFSKWTETISETNMELEINDDYTIEGTYAAMSAHLDYWSPLSYFYKEFGSTYFTLYYRAYFYFESWDSLDWSDRYLNIMATIGNGEIYENHWRLQIVPNADEHHIRLYYRDDGSYSTEEDTSVDLQLDTWYCIEVKTVVHESAGEYRVYLDGSEIITLTDLVSNDYGDVSGVIAGVSFYSSMINGQVDRVYIDSVIAADEYFGPVT